MSIIITETDKKRLFEFIRWKIDNPHPCRSCSSNFGSCTGCDKQKNYDSEYGNKIEDVPYNNMNYQKLIDAYGRLYQAQKAQQEAIKACNDAAKDYTKILQEYTVLNNTGYLRPGDIIESIPQNLNNCPQIKLDKKYSDLGYHVRKDIQTKLYYVFKELVDLRDPAYPYRFMYLGSFDKLENAHRALLEDRDTSSKFSIE